MESANNLSLLFKNFHHVQRRHRIMCGSIEKYDCMFGGKVWLVGIANALNDRLMLMLEK